MRQCSKTGLKNVKRNKHLARNSLLVNSTTISSKLELCRWICKKDRCTITHHFSQKPTGFYESTYRLAYPAARQSALCRRPYASTAAAPINAPATGRSCHARTDFLSSLEVAPMNQPVMDGITAVE